MKTENFTACNKFKTKKKVLVGTLIYVNSTKCNISQKSWHCVKSVQILSFSGPYFPVFRVNTGKYRPEKTSYLDTFHAVRLKEEC